MKKTLLFATIAAFLTINAHAGVGTAAKKALETVANANFVVAGTTQAEGVSLKGPYALMFLANAPVFPITSKLSMTVGVDIRSEFEFANQFSNLGIGGGLSYTIADHFVAQAGYAHDLTGVTDKTGKIYVGFGFTRK